MTGMEFLDFVVIMTAIILTVILIWMRMASSNALKLQEFAEKARIAEIRRKAADTRYGKSNEPEVGAWVEELAQTAGFDVSQLFQDDMPPEIAKLLPIAKGFIESGGLQKLLGAADGPAQPGQQPPGGNQGCI
ncbi:MAG: hypothetical protein M0Q12_09110 [Synergistaceae bacterium]|jgi:hypothetical protein|nr:hypothetical protein [Synergistaceae bacterium]